MTFVEKMESESDTSSHSNTVNASHLAKKVSEMTDTVKSLKSDMERAKVKYENEIKERDEHIRQMSDQLEELVQTKVDLQKRLSTMEDEYESKLTKAAMEYDQRMARLTHTLEKNRQQLESVLSELESTKSKAIAKLNAELSERDAELDETREHLAQVEQELVHMQGVCERIAEKMEDHVTTLQMDLETKDDVIARLQDELLQKSTELDHAVTRLIDVEQCFSKSQTTSLGFNEENKRLREELTTMEKSWREKSERMKVS